MKRLACILLIMATVMAFSSCNSSQTQNIIQVSSYNHFGAGNYDGIYPVGKLLSKVNMGIGSVDRFDGELIIIDNTPYQILASGECVETDRQLLIPYATTCQFVPDTSFVLKGEHLYCALDRIFPDTTKFLAIRADGLFDSMVSRSVYPQSKPYPSLAEIMATQQVVFENYSTEGTLIGFRNPPHIKNINTPGYHSHYLSNDRKIGGHILKFASDSLLVQIQVYDNLTILEE